MKTYTQVQKLTYTSSVEIANPDCGLNPDLMYFWIGRIMDYFRSPSHVVTVIFLGPSFLQKQMPVEALGHLTKVANSSDMFLCCRKKWVMLTVFT